MKTYVINLETKEHFNFSIQELNSYLNKNNIKKIFSNNEWGFFKFNKILVMHPIPIFEYKLDEFIIPSDFLDLTEIEYENIRILKLKCKNNIRYFYYTNNNKLKEALMKRDKDKKVYILYINGKRIYENKLRVIK